jgi:hypothetical protein
MQQRPKLLFYRIEQCQEIMTLGKLSYMLEQVILDVLCLLMALQIFPLREFDTWENTTIKTYPSLKTFIHEAYSCCLNSMELCNTPSSMGCTAPAHNMYHMLDMGKDDDNDITVATIVAAAVATTTSPLGHGTAASSLHTGQIAAINQSIAPAFNQVMQNQTILQNQIAVMSMAHPPPTQAPANQYIVPPVHHVAFLMQQPVQAHMQQQQYHQTNGFGRGQQGQFQGGRGSQGGRGLDAVAVPADASIVLHLRPRFASRMVKDEWSNTKAIMGASLHCLIHMVE